MRGSIAALICETSEFELFLFLFQGMLHFTTVILFYNCTSVSFLSCLLLTENTDLTNTELNSEF